MQTNLTRHTARPLRLALASLLGLCLAISAVSLTGCASTATSKSAGEYVDDAAITSKVKTSLIKDPVVKALQVDVDTYKGVVSLSGFVDNQDQIRRAGEIASQVVGVREVRNNLTIKPTGAR
jgi:osmotically-inducible protein OsmY